MTATSPKSNNQIIWMHDHEHYMNKLKSCDLSMTYKNLI